MSLGDDVWDSIEIQWTHHIQSTSATTSSTVGAINTGATSSTSIDDAVTRLKPKFELTLRDKAASNTNAKTLNSILNGVKEIQFRMISNCTTTKEAWDTLEIAFEGLEDVGTTT